MSQTKTLFPGACLRCKGYALICNTQLWFLAETGRPNIAIGAVYGAPVLNLYMGVTTMGIIGSLKYGLPYKIKVDQQM